MRTIRTTTIAILAVGLLAGSTVGVAAQDEAASQFFGNVVDEHEAGPILEMSDPRASGELTVIENGSDWTGPLGSTFGWRSESVRLVNEGGTWTGSGNNVDSTWGGLAGWVMTGNGDYDGLTMVLQEGGRSVEDDYEYWGIIVPTDEVPAFPDLPAE